MRGGRDDPSMARYPSSFSRHTSPHPMRRRPASEASGGAVFGTSRTSSPSAAARTCCRSAERGRRCDVKVVNRLVNGRTSVSAPMALKLGATFGTTPDFWLNAQKAVDIYRALHDGLDLPRPIVQAS